MGANTYLKKIVFSFVFCFSLASQSQPRADLTEGTLFFSGGLMFDYRLEKFTNPKHIFSLTSDMGFGYFVVDNFAVGGSIPLVWNISPNSEGELGLKLFTTYFIDIDSIIFPYIGANITPGYRLNANKFLLNVGLDTGVLISMSESVALDLGIRPNLNIKLSNEHDWVLNVPFGFVGVRAFF